MSRELHYTEDDYGTCMETCPYAHLTLEEGESGLSRNGTKIGSIACAECKFNEYVHRTVKYVICTADEAFDKVKPVKCPIVVINKDDNRVFKRNMIKGII